MRLIDADALKSVEKEVVCGKVRTPYAKDKTAVLRVFEVDEIRNAPTIDAEPVRHGHWINAYPDIEPNPMFMYGICSECGFEQGISSKLNYCPNCGAKMDE